MANNVSSASNAPFSGVSAVQTNVDSQVNSQIDGCSHFHVLGLSIPKFMFSDKTKAAQLQGYEDLIHAMLQQIEQTGIGVGATAAQDPPRKPLPPVAGGGSPNTAKR